MTDLSEKLGYGENPHQEALLLRDGSGRGIANAKQIHGKQMSYNNYVDADAAIEAVAELDVGPAVAIVKHTNPCGYAIGHGHLEVLQRAWQGDPVSAFGGVIAMNSLFTMDAAQFLEDKFVEIIIASEIRQDVMDYIRSLDSKKNLRLFELKIWAQKGRKTIEKQIGGGVLVQTVDDRLYLPGSFENRDNPVLDLFKPSYSYRDPTKPVRQQIPGPTVGVVTDAQPDERLAGLYDHAWKAAKHVKSNAIVIAREYARGCYQILGIGSGQPNRRDSVRLAAEKTIQNLEQEAEELGREKKDYVQEEIQRCALASDAMFPFRDNIDYAVEIAGIKHIIQPGGSNKDKEVIAAANEHGMAMIFTGIRHFKH